MGIMGNMECCGTTNALEQRMLWNNESCGEQHMGWKRITPANYVEHGMLWNNECCGEHGMLWNNECCGTTNGLEKNNSSELCGTWNAVEQRIMWNIECCGKTNAVEQHMVGKKITPANYHRMWNNE